MSEKNPNIERAASVIARYFAEDVTQPFRYPKAHGTAAMIAARAAEDAGLLLTPLHEKALEACEEYAKLWPSPTTIKANADVHKVGRDSLALKEKAKGARWVAKNYSGSVWAIEQEGALADAPVVMFQHFTEQQARRVAAALNEESGK